MPWLAEFVSDLTLPVELASLSGGHSNLTYQLTDGNGKCYVLRRPPLAIGESTAHDVVREWRIILRLHQTAVPVPRPVALCTDPTVIGAPFFLMEFVPGKTIRDSQTASTLSTAARHQLADALIAVLALVHAQDVDAVGLSDLVRPGGLVARQIRRWRKQLDAYPVLTSPLIRDVQHVLERVAPTEQRTTIVHGDYKLSNVRVDEHGNVLAVLDWELTAIGDPLVDLGWLLASWGEQDDTRPWIVAPPTSAGGFPDPDTLVSHYAARSTVDLENIGFYVAFAHWRWACINEGLLARSAAGAIGKEIVHPDAVKEQIRWQLEAAWNLLAS